MKKWLICFALMLPVLSCQGQPKRAKVDYVTTPEDRVVAEKVLSKLKAHRDEAAGAQMVRAAEALLGQPYVAGTLEELPEEKLCIYLTRTDCILFVETCLGLVRTAEQDGDFETLASELMQSRYRGGKCSRYEDRLHYTTEWARQGVARGVLEDVTGQLGGVRFNHPVNYMSTHPGSYARLTDVDAIAGMERKINATPATYIPKAKVNDALSGIRNGDILFFTSKTDGLDVAHCGIAKIVPGAPVRFIHASTVPMKVVLEPKTLTEYLAGRKAVSGIQVYRIR